MCIEETTGCRILKIALRTENLGNYSKVEDRVSRGIRFLVTLNYDQIFPEAGVDGEGSLSTRSERWSLPLPSGMGYSCKGPGRGAHQGYNLVEIKDLSELQL